MAKVEITKSLFLQIDKKFKQRSVEVFQHLKSLEDHPQKGKLLGTVGGIVIKELKFEGFRFYFITDGFKLKFLQISELHNLLIKFVRMSDKKTQQKTIEEIKKILKSFGKEGFD